MIGLISKCTLGTANPHHKLQKQDHSRGHEEVIRGTHGLSRCTPIQVYQWYSCTTTVPLQGLRTHLSLCISASSVSHAASTTSGTTFNAVVTSTLPYRVGTWMRKESQMKRLASVQYRLARCMLGVKPTNHVCMTKAYESLGMTSLRVLLNRRTMVWTTKC